MLKYARVVDPEKGMCSVGTGTDEKFYKSIGMEILNVEEGYDGNWYLAGMVPEPVYTVEDYDRAMEEHIKETRVARGYTTREPSYYLQSSVPRWRQDALDWVDFVDSVMLYGLEVQNKYISGESVPSLEEFKAGLPECVWRFEG
jgi:hypothetical protein